MKKRFIIASIILVIPYVLFAKTILKNSLKAIIDKTNQYVLVDSSLVGWWTFDGKNIVKNVADSSGKGNNGDMVGFGATSSAVVQGKLGQALSFNGVNNGITIPSFTLGAGHSFTITDWVNHKPATPSTYETILDDSTANYGMFIDHSSDHTLYYNDCYYNGDYVASTYLSKNRWYFLSCVFNATASTITSYTNAIQDSNYSSVTQSANPSWGNIGDDVNNELYRGYLDDVRIYNRALSAKEVQQLYQSGLGTILKKSL